MEVHHTVSIAEPGVGIDVGSSLAKITTARGGAVSSHFVYAHETERIAAAIEAAGSNVRAVTGAGAASWHALHGDAIQVVGEFEAVASGARALLAAEGTPISEPVLVVSVGTGTSALLVDATSVTRIGGTALGGGSLMGLGRLLCKTDDYDHLAALAASGDRGNVDLLVRHIYPEGLDGVPAGLTAANFGRVESEAVPDLAQALCGLLGENLGLLCGQLARLSGAGEVIYCGATLAGNAVLQGILVGTTAFAGAPARVLDGGAFCGSLGALLLAACPDGHSA